ncbi:MAG: TIGR02147 family protein [Bdellovibrionaceae bacterium]|nr:TIGR02147 family protein [Pseudobdellovibrionaceae bacterium]
MFRFQDYKRYVNERIESLPKQGHGEYRRMALALRVSTTLMSQVFRGEKHLSLEMAADLCDYLHLDDHEAQFFLLLVEFQKSGSANLKEKLKRRIVDEQKKNRSLEKKLDLHDRQELSDEDKAIYYSSWMYAGIRNLCALHRYEGATDLAERLGLPVFQVEKILEFLLSRNLVIREGAHLAFGPAWTHVPAKSLLVVKHHQNWRIQAFQKMVFADDQNLFFTGPMNMSSEVAQKIREELPEFISRITQMVAPSEAEVVRCLNIDFFEY